MKFRITIEDEVYKVTQATSDIKFIYRMFLDEKQPYEASIDFTSGTITGEHDIPDGSYRAIVEVFDKSYEKQQAGIEVTGNIIKVTRG